MSAKDPKSIREAVLKAALPEIAHEGFNDDVLVRAGKKLGLKPIEVNSAFPHGAASLVEEFSHWADARMSAKLKASKEKGMTARIKAAVRSRIEAVAPHKEAVRRGTAFLALPQHAPLGAKLVYRTVDAMWRAAGDRSTDFNFYTKRATLAGVYGATLLYWLADESKDNKNTWAFLDHRLADVMTFEKFKKSARETISKLPDPLGFFTGWRGRSNE
jgi:ubiquinone biosynthesis protein COQ9